METLEILEAVQGFELVLGFSGCCPDLDSAFYLDDYYTLPGHLRELLPEMGLEIGGAVEY